MKLFSLQILFKTGDQCKLLQASHELSTFRYFHRSSVKEFMVFTGKLVGEKTERCQRGLVKEQEYICHVFVRHDNLCGVLIADQEYPQRVAQTLLTKYLQRIGCQDFHTLACFYSAQTTWVATRKAACQYRLVSALTISTFEAQHVYHMDAGLAALKCDVWFSATNQTFVHLIMWWG
ncbi:hypothetical protein CRM22_009724 [Opisthorchis felineus]|uniref:Longin domain-containing protein n=1 Tax=Opisthorchis felineus TaxID=147828 RepID=A0A4S2L7K2_OPIFE|nr:hypothetical protein CRM22_009724 [Opisthorchis felineus]TGZ58246.1 hypothetical protein CRM22_009724 [Opisthorchis felineus]